MGKIENFISRVPTSALGEGFVEDLTTTVPEGCVLNTEDFHSKLSDRYQMPDLSMTMENSFKEFSRGHLTNSTLRLLDRFVPDQSQDVYGEVNNYLNENLVVARELLNEKLAEDSINEEQMHEQVLAGKCLDPELQFAVSQVHEYAWYLTLFNYRQMYVIAKKCPMWNSWGESERQDFLQSSLIGSWNLACRFDSQKGSFGNYLNVSLPGTALSIHFNYLKENKTRYQDYIQLYKKANALLGEFKIPSREECIMLTSLLHDERNNKVVFPKEKVMEALQEYCAIFHGRSSYNELDPSKQILEWIDPHRNFQQIVRKRCRRMRAILGIVNPFSLDEERELRVANPITGDHRFIKYKLNPVSTTKGPEEAIIEKETKQKLSELMEGLSERQIEVLKYRLGFGGSKPKTLDETGEILGITRERVRQIQLGAVRDLKRSSFYYREIKERSY